jgi:hypothetical protein
MELEGIRISNHEQSQDQSIKFEKMMHATHLEMKKTQEANDQKMGDMKS